MNNFNWWFIVAPLLVVATEVLGITKYKMDEKSLKILVRGGGDFLLRVVAMAFTAVIHFMILSESGAGIVQFIASHLGDSDIAWTPVVVAFGLISSIAFFYLLLFEVGKIGEWARYGYLTLRRNAINKRIAAKEAEKKFSDGIKTVKRDEIDLIVF